MTPKINPFEITLKMQIIFLSKINFKNMYTYYFYSESDFISESSLILNLLICSQNVSVYILNEVFTCIIFFASDLNMQKQLGFHWNTI